MATSLTGCLLPARSRFNVVSLREQASVTGKHSARCQGEGTQEGLHQIVIAVLRGTLAVKVADGKAQELERRWRGAQANTETRQRLLQTCRSLLLPRLPVAARPILGSLSDRFLPLQTLAQRPLSSPTVRHCEIGTGISREFLFFSMMSEETSK